MACLNFFGFEMMGTAMGTASSRWRMAVAVVVASMCAAAAACASASNDATPVPSTSVSGTATPATSSRTEPPSPDTTASRGTTPGTTPGTSKLALSRDAFAPAPPEWEPCTPAGYECATLQVPLDYSKPDGLGIDLALKRRPATSHADRIGSIFYNPGGPGASGVEGLPQAVAGLDAETLRTFDVVSWDPRGVGGSVPVNCREGALDFYEEDLSVAELAPTVDQAAEAFGQQCEANAGNVLPFVGTLDTVRDLDVLREAVGDEKVNYLGVSYGTLIGQTYAMVFPERIRAMVLDGVVDPTVEGDQSNIDQSRSVDEAIGRFASWCRSQPSCAIRNDPEGALDQLQARARAGQMSITIDGKQRVLSPTLAELGVIVATYDDAVWPDLARAIAQANAGDETLFTAFVKAYIDAASFGANAAINCLDAERPTEQEVEQTAAKAAPVAPRTGRFNANASLVCTFWPAEPKPLPDTYSFEHVPPILVWGTTGDNATPYKNAVHVSELLPGSTLATLEGNRHAAIGAGPCVAAILGTYFVDLELPAEGTRC